MIFYHLKNLISHIAVYPYRYFNLISIGMSLAWFIILFTIKIHMYRAMMLTSDLAYYCNVLFNTNLEKFLYSDFAFFQFGFTTFLSDHFSPSLALLVPLYKLFPTPVLLLFLQVFSIAATGWLVAQIGKILVIKNRHLPRQTLIMILLLQLFYLYNPYSISSTIDSLYGFHHDSFYPLLLSTVIFFYIKHLNCNKLDKNKFCNRYLLFSGLSFILLLGMKENLPYLCVVFFFPLLFVKHTVKRQYAIWAIACSIMMWAGAYYFQYLIVTNVRNTNAVLQFFSLEGWILAAPKLQEWLPIVRFIFLFIVPEAILPFLAELALQLFSPANIFDWHSFIIFCIGFISSVFGIIRLTNWIFSKQFKHGEKILCLLLLFTFLLYLPPVWKGCNHLIDAYDTHFERKASVQMSNIEYISAYIPHDASLATTSDLLVFFVNRPHLRWPTHLENIDFVLTSSTASLFYDDEFRNLIKKMEKEGAMIRIMRAGLLDLYRHNRD